MKKVQPVNLTSDEALVLQQIAENGEDDVIGLSRGLSMSRSQVAKQLDRLRAKKLVTIKATCGDLWVRASKRGRQAVISVRDEGVGMDKETLERIFTRFYRAEESRTTEGYGLGLAIAQKIVQAHGGKISAQSRKGKGATFTVILPLADKS